MFQRRLRHFTRIRIPGRNHLIHENRQVLFRHRAAQRLQRGAPYGRVRVFERLQERWNRIDPPLADDFDQHRVGLALRLAQP